MSNAPTTEKKEMSKTRFSKETYLKWYEDMLLMRRFEERAGQLYGMQKIKGFCHLYIGQEALMAGAMSVLRPEDAMITAYRDHAHALAKGISAREVMAELYGKITGCSKGKGGSMHMFRAPHRFSGGHGIVGGQIPLGAGIAFAEKYKGIDLVCVCYMGDGAVRQGAFHEALNMAMTWKLPVIFIIENNNYAMGTSVERTSNVTDLYKLGLAYDMPSEPVDGMSCEAVREAMHVHHVVVEPALDVPPAWRDLPDERRLLFLAPVPSTPPRFALVHDAVLGPAALHALRPALPAPTAAPTRRRARLAIALLAALLAALSALALALGR